MSAFNKLFPAIALTIAIAPPLFAAETSGKFDPASIEFFEKKVRPLLVENCYNCHSANTNAKGDLRVDDRNGLIGGGSSGPAIVPGAPEKSLLIRAVKYRDDDLKMPPKKQLSADEVAILEQWIKDGAAWPEVPTLAVGKPNPKYEQLRKEHWAWQPLSAAKPPETSNRDWPRDEIDRFVLAKLEASHLKPADDAQRSALIRRLTFDLTGLPPAPQEIDDFTSDVAPGALENVVDRLLASPAFGERWGRHWLDVARYGESTGSSRNVPYPHAWRYRDYVINSLNSDKPYNQFVREQIAGDLLPAESAEEKSEHLVATGFLALGVKDVNQRFKVRFVMDNIDEQIDTVSRSILGLTVSCARCHDHKFDPIPQNDYYALAGIFHSTELCAGVRNKMGGGGLDYYDPQLFLGVGDQAEPDEVTRNKIADLTKRAAEAKAEFQSLRNNPAGDVKTEDGRPRRQVARQRMNKLQNELLALTDPSANGRQATLGVREATSIGDTEIRIRGEAEKLGPLAPRGFLTLLGSVETPHVGEQESGRLQLAQWLTDEKNPLTSRVIVNRVWQHLFGQGLVKTVDNFGVKGDVPSHPELLDHLAARFVRDGWSIKKLVRAIVLSHAYGLSSETSPANIDADPSNRLIWRHSPRRLEAEELRDATLFVAGTLDRQPGEASPVKQFKVVELRNNGPEARKLESQARESLHRSVYLPLLRGLTPNSLEVFDFAEQGMVTGSRDTTTVAPQSLYLLNDALVRRQSLTFADHLLSSNDESDELRLARAYRVALGRTATWQEIQRAKRYLADYKTELSTVSNSSKASVKEPSLDNAEATDKIAADVGNGSVEETASGDESKKSPTSNESSDAKADNRSAEQQQSDAPALKLNGAGKGKKNSKGANQAQAGAAIDAKGKLPPNPDEADQSDTPVKEEVIEASNPRQAAWASFCQALFGSAEFRYVR